MLWINLQITNFCSITSLSYLITLPTDKKQNILQIDGPVLSHDCFQSEASLRELVLIKFFNAPPLNKGSANIIEISTMI